MYSSLTDEFLKLIGSLSGIGRLVVRCKIDVRHCCEKNILTTENKRKCRSGISSTQSDQNFAGSIISLVPVCEVSCQLK